MRVVSQVEIHKLSCATSPIKSLCMSRPWMPLYIADLEMDTLDLKPDEFGVYVAMLCLAWHRDGPLPSDDRLKLMLQRCLRDFHGLSYNRIVPKLLDRYFYSDAEGNWRQKRVEKELRKSREISENASRKSRESWRNRSPNEQLQPLNGSQSNGSAKLSTTTITTTKKDSLNGEIRQKRENPHFVKAGTPQWKAWAEQFPDCPAPIVHWDTKELGWYFPTEWPPSTSKS